MIFIQILLDDISPENGAMEIALGSHKFGRITSDKIEQIITDSGHELVTGKAGDVIFLKALTLHRSRSHSLPSKRRTLCIDYFAGSLQKRCNFHFNSS